jgi:PAS domain S-box-containing protein
VKSSLTAINIKEHPVSTVTRASRGTRRSSQPNGASHPAPGAPARQIDGAIYADIVARMPIGMCVWRLDNLDDPRSLWLAAANPAAEGAAGMVLHDKIGQPFDVLFPTLAGSPLLEIYAEIIRSGEARSLGEQVFAGGEGEQLTFAIEAFPILDQAVCITFENITAQKRTEAALRASEADITSLFEQSPIGFALSAMDGTLVRVNAAYARILGRTIAETLTLSPREITPAIHRAADAEQMRALAASGRYGPYEKELVHREGHLVPVRVSGMVVERGGQPFVWSSVEDITDWRQAEEVISAQAAMLQELSTPLLSISDSVVVMPLVGAIDSQRAQNVIEALLSGVSEQRATTAIIDITGVIVVDTQVANAIVRAAQAVKLLGAQAVLTGIRPEVAQTLIQLGVDLRDIVTRGTLQGGIAYAIGSR